MSTCSSSLSLSASPSREMTTTTTTTTTTHEGMGDHEIVTTTTTVATAAAAAASDLSTVHMEDDRIDGNNRGGVTAYDRIRNQRRIHRPTFGLKRFHHNQKPDDDNNDYETVVEEKEERVERTTGTVDPVSNIDSNNAIEQDKSSPETDAVLATSHHVEWDHSKTLFSSSLGETGHDGVDKMTDNAGYNNMKEFGSKQSNDLLSQHDHSTKTNATATHSSNTLNSSQGNNIHDSSIAIPSETSLQDHDVAEPPPTIEEILQTTNILFQQVQDKATVTVKDILVALQMRFACESLSKPIKRAVRERLAELMTAILEEHHDDTPGDQPDEKEQHDDGERDSTIGTSTPEDRSEDEGESDEDEMGEQPDFSDDDDDEEDFTPESSSKKRRKRHDRTRGTKGLKIGKQKSPTGKDEQSSRRGPGRDAKQRAKTAARALRIHAEQLRKRRMEELRVRNEELMMQQSKEDMERAEKIAQKFETQSDEQIWARLEQRVGLLEKLDQKRLAVIQAEDVGAFVKDCSGQPTSDTSLNLEPGDRPVTQDNIATIVSSEESKQMDELIDLEDDSDEELEVEIIPSKQENQRPLDPLTLLDFSPKVKQPRNAVVVTSPGLNARAALRSKLRTRQRELGNRWLALELGYRDEKDHLQHCMELEQQTRETALKAEQERMQESERRRKRLLELGLQAEEEDSHAPGEDDGSEADVEDVGGDESDEEMALAKQVESEKGMLMEEREQQEVDSQSEAHPCDPTTNGDSTSDKNVDDIINSTWLSTNTVLRSVDPFMNIESSTTLNKAVIDRDCEDESFSSDRGKLRDHAIVNPEIDSPVVRTSYVSNDKEDYTPCTVGVEGLKNDDNQNESDHVIFAPETDSPVARTNYESDDKEDCVSVKDETVQNENKPKGPRNAAWKAALEKEAETAKKLKQRKSNGLVEVEADEEEEEYIAGLEEFGFGRLKKTDKEGDEEDSDVVNDDDLDNIVDELSDNEGDEEAGEDARRNLERQAEKERHKLVIRQVRDGFDGRRGLIAGGGAARGLHRFDELVAADNREEAKRLGLMTKDELESDNEKEDDDDGEEEEDEAALLDKMIRDRYRKGSTTEYAENFSDDEVEDNNDDTNEADVDPEELREEKEQEILAKRFEKRARMQRLLDVHGNDEEFSRSRLIDEDVEMKLDLQTMKNGLARKRSISSTTSTSNTGSSISEVNRNKKKKINVAFGSNFLGTNGSLNLALQASRRSVSRTSFGRARTLGSTETRLSSSVAINASHVVFSATENSQLSRSNLSLSSISRDKSISDRMEPPKSTKQSTSLWSRAVVGGFQKRR